MEVNGTLCARCLLVSSLASPTGAHRKGILRSAAATSGNTDMKGRTSERKRKPPAIVAVVCNGFCGGQSVLPVAGRWIGATRLQLKNWRRRKGKLCHFLLGLNARNAETVWYTVWTMYC